MMEVKLFEIRDEATFMPVMAVRLASTLEKQRERELWLLRRAGYGLEQLLACEKTDETIPYVILCKLDGVEAQYDPYGWKTGARTIPEAHKYIIEHWYLLDSAAVIDVQYILGETPNPKESEMEKVHY